jgi:hypothetical protein
LAGGEELDRGEERQPDRLSAESLCFGCGLGVVGDVVETGVVVDEGVG